MATLEGDKDLALELSSSVEAGALAAFQSEATAILHAAQPSLSPKPEATASQPSDTRAEPPTDQTQPPKAATQTIEYTVKPGDNLWTIARKQLKETTGHRPRNSDVLNYVEEIIKDNHIHNPDLIRPGETFKLASYVPPADHYAELRRQPEHHRWYHKPHGLKAYPYPYPGEHSHGEHHDDNHEHAGDMPPAQPVPRIEPHNNKASDKSLIKDSDRTTDNAKDQPDKTDNTKNIDLLAQELHSLKDIAHKQVHDKDKLAGINENAQALAETEDKKANMYKLKDKSLTDSEAHNQARAEIVDTLKQAERLLQADKSAKLSRDYLQATAAEMLHHAAHPEHINQGIHPTCQTTAIESMTYLIQPSKAAKLVADVALTGQFTAHDGNKEITVKIDPEPDTEASWYSLQGKQRDLASQIFQNTAINLAWAVKDPTGKTHYVEKADLDTRTVKEGLVQKPGSTARIDSSHENDPDLYASDVATMHRLITGSNEKAVVVESSSNKHCDPDTVCISSLDELGKVLKQYKEEGKLPIILYVNTSIEGPLHAANGATHSILATDYISGLNPKIHYYNWWGSSATDQDLDLNYVYRAMQAN